jgi:hypothetical protein
MSNEPRLRGQLKRRSGPYPLGEISMSVAIEIGKHIVHRLAVGQTDITGDDFGGIFARAIGGDHRNRPFGIADVVWHGCAWSVKTIQGKKPFNQKKVRVISGRNSPVFASEISDPYADIQATGKSVLNVWNARVNESLNEHDDLRIFVMIRNMTDLEFTLIEYEAVRFVAAEYFWKLNKKRNLEGFDRETGARRFTWQPSGSQFTVFHHVPSSALRFQINQRPGMIEEQYILDLVHFQEDWIEPITTMSPSTRAVPEAKAAKEDDFFPQV